MYVGGGIGALLILGYISTPFIINTVITGTLMFVGAAIIVKHIAKDRPKMIPYITKYKNILDITMFTLATSAFFFMGVTAGMGFTIAGILMSLAFIGYKKAGFDKILNRKKGTRKWLFI